jgi:hypothetical protein
MKSIPFESTGRLCNGQWVIKKVPFNMPEFITWEPFCNVRHENSLKEYIDKVIISRKKFLEIIMREPITKEIVEKNGELIQYPTGMTRYLKCPKNGSISNYTFLKKKGVSHKGSERDDLVRPEYVGSYHVTITLPHKEDISQKEFISIHQNYANQLQWLEPLMLTSYFSQDQFACGSKEERVRGSFRVMIIGWGNFAGSDVRLFDEGIGRYSKSQIFWRKGLKLYEYEKINPCIPPSPSAIAEGATTTLSSNFRTFGSTDPLRPEHRESGVGMTKPNGIEFRIFDHFQDTLYIDSLVELLGIVAENSRITKCSKYVYKNKYWIGAMHEIMKNGYTTIDHYLTPNMTMKNMISRVYKSDEDKEKIDEIERYYRVITGHFKHDTIYKNYHIDDKQFYHLSHKRRSRDVYTSNIKSIVNNHGTPLSHIENNSMNSSTLEMFNPDIEDYASTRVRNKDLKKRKDEMLF